MPKGEKYNNDTTNAQKKQEKEYNTCYRIFLVLIGIVMCMCLHSLSVIPVTLSNYFKIEENNILSSISEKFLIDLGMILGFLYISLSKTISSSKNLKITLTCFLLCLFLQYKSNSYILHTFATLSQSFIFVVFTLSLGDPIQLIILSMANMWGILMQVYGDTGGVRGVLLGKDNFCEGEEVGLYESVSGGQGRGEGERGVVEGIVFWGFVGFAGVFGGFFVFHVFGRFFRSFYVEEKTIKTVSILEILSDNQSIDFHNENQLPNKIKHENEYLHSNRTIALITFICLSMLLALPQTLTDPSNDQFISKCSNFLHEKEKTLSYKFSMNNFLSVKSFEEENLLYLNNIFNKIILEIMRYSFNSNFYDVFVGVWEPEIILQGIKSILYKIRYLISMCLILLSWFYIKKHQNTINQNENQANAKTTNKNENKKDKTISQKEITLLNILLLTITFIFISFVFAIIAMGYGITALGVIYIFRTLGTLWIVFGEICLFCAYFLNFSYPAKDNNTSFNFHDNDIEILQLDNKNQNENIKTNRNGNVDQNITCFAFILALKGIISLGIQGAMRIVGSVRVWFVILGIIVWIVGVWIVILKAYINKQEQSVGSVDSEETQRIFHRELIHEHENN